MKKRFLEEEKGAIFIEASMVFPVMFFVIFILIYFGNAFFIRSCVDSVVTQEAIKGAAYCADPLLEEISKSGVPTSAKDVDVRPYSGVFGNSEATTTIQNELEEELGKIGCGFFYGMAPSYSRSEVKYNNYIVCSNFSVNVEYTIKLPIRFIGSNEPILLNIHSEYVQPVNDSANFIRNVDMIDDYLIKTGAKDKIISAFGKVKEFFSELFSLGGG